MASIDPGVYRIVNPANGRPFKGKWNNIVYTVEPGSENIVPIDAVHGWMGQPDLFDISREDRKRKLRSRF